MPSNLLGNKMQNFVYENVRTRCMVKIYDLERTTFNNIRLLLKKYQEM